jgi:hypothetical protein
LVGTSSGSTVARRTRPMDELISNGTFTPGRGITGHAV